MSDNKTEKKYELSDEQKKLSEQFAGKISVVDDKLTVSPDGYLTLLPEDIPADLLKKLSKHNRTFFVGSADALEQAAEPLFKKNADLTQLKVEIPLGARGDTYEVTIDRRKEVSGPANRDNPRIMHGYVTGKLTTAAANTASADFKNLREVIDARRASAYAE